MNLIEYFNVLTKEAVKAGTNYYCWGIGVDGKLIQIIHLIFNALYIGVPLLLIIFGMIDLGKAVTQSKEEEIKKAQSLFIKRIITAAIVFFVVAIVKMVVSIVSDSSGGITVCIDCFTSGNCHKCDTPSAAGKNLTCNYHKAKK